MVGYPRRCTHHRGQPGGRADLVQLGTSGDLKLVGVGRGRLGLASTVVRLTDTVAQVIADRTSILRRLKWVVGVVVMIVLLNWLSVLASRLAT